MKPLLAATKGSSETVSKLQGRRVEEGRNPFPQPGLSLPDTNTILAELSHDLRTPLNTIIGFAGILLSHRIGKLNEQQEKELSIVLKRGSELLNIIDQLVEYCKVIRHDVEIRQGLFALTPFLNTAVENLRGSLPGKEITLTYHPPTLSHRLMGDEQKLYQVLRHIFEAGISLVKTRKILIGAGELEGEKDSSSRSRIRIEIVFVGAGGVKPESLFSWNGAGKVPAKIRFGMHLSNFYIRLMGGDLSVSQARGRMIFQLTFTRKSYENYNKQRDE